MRKSFILSAAAALAISGMTVTLYAQDATGAGNPGTPPATQPIDRDGDLGDRAQGTMDRVEKSGEARSVHNLLSNTTEAALSKNGFDNVVRRFVDADRNRIGKNDLTDADWAKLNGRIEQFQKDWKAKYNQDFDIEKEDVVFNEQFRIQTGEIGEAQPAGGRMDPGAPNTTPGQGNEKVGGGDANRDPGRNVAKVTFPASHGMPNVYIPLVNEFPGVWKIDVPDSVDGRKLYDNLLSHLTMANEMKDQWPADVNDAYRAVSHHVFMAIMDMPAQKGSSDQMQPGQNQPGIRPADDPNRPSTPADPNKPR
jgi:hypothetical protein